MLLYLAVLWKSAEKMSNPKKVATGKKTTVKKSDDHVDSGQAKITVQEFYEIEDAEAMASNPEADETDFAHCCDQLLSGFREFKDATESSDKTEIKTRITLAIMMIRRLNRLGHFRNRKLREETSEERKQVEEQHLQLQNLIHEVQHLQKEVTRCLEFQSAHERIDLAPIAEFYKTAPAEVSKPEVTKTDSHQLRLARLTWELEQRKSLAEQLKNMEAKKEEMGIDLAAKTERLSTLKPKLDSVLVASRPLQEMMNMRYEDEAVEREMAQFLPKQLYYLYLQARAYREILDQNLLVSISGEVDLAKKIKSGLEPKSGTETPDEESGNEEEESQETTGGLKTRKRRSTVTEAVEKHKSDILKLHPLAVELKSNAKNQAVIRLTFYYCAQLEIVTVKTRVELSADIPRGVASAGNLMSDSTVLQFLCEGDSGLVCPNPTALKKLEHFGIDISEKVEDIGHPYRWTQRLAGLTFPNEDWSEEKKETDEVEGCNFLQKILRCVKSRVLSRLSLQQQIASLEMQKVEPVVEIEGLESSKIMSKLTSWTSLTYEDYKYHPANQPFPDEIPDPSDGWFFSATIEKSDAKLRALVRVAAAYPEEPPFFILVLKWRGTRTSADWESLRHLEEGVNLHVPGMVPSKHMDSLLIMQIHYLLSRLDILLEAESSRGYAVDFRRDHLFTRSSRGKSRELPFNFKKQTNSFVF